MTDKRKDMNSERGEKIEMADKRKEHEKQFFWPARSYRIKKIIITVRFLCKDNSVFLVTFFWRVRLWMFIFLLLFNSEAFK